MILATMPAAFELTVVGLAVLSILIRRLRPSLAERWRWATLQSTRRARSQRLSETSGEGFVRH